MTSASTSGERAARGLGWTSLAIAAAELAAPAAIARGLGVDADAATTGTLRALGARELAHGVDLLAHRDARAGVYGRLAGDALDGALLAAAGARTRNPRGFAFIAIAVLGVALADLIVARRLAR